MPRMNLLLILFPVRVLFAPPVECEEIKPYHEYNEKVLEQRFVYKEYTADESWDLAFEQAYKDMKKGKCRKIFKEITNREPLEFAASGEYVFHLSEDWHRPDYICYTTCDPPWIACDKQAAIDFSPSFLGATIIHEFVHAANCTNWWKKYSPDERGITPLEQDEIVAAMVEVVCE